MSRALLVRSIPLSASTRNAWKAAGATFARRDRRTDSIVSLAEDIGGVPIINLGASWFSAEGAWNPGEVTKWLLTPESTRRMFNDFLPTGRWVGPDYYWFKGPGRAGNNKKKHYVSNLEEYNELASHANWIQGDVQLHVDGQEFRVITVNDKVVQGMARYGQNGERRYEWVGVGGLPTELKESCRRASRVLGSRTIVGWDGIVHDSGQSFILEGNACPGVNEATAGRILDAVEGVTYA